MRYFSKLMALTILVFPLFLTSPSMVSAENSKDEQEAKKVVEIYFKALNESNAEKIIELYHKDSVFLPKNAPAVRGINEIQKTYRNLFGQIKLNTKHIYHHVSVHGDVAILESQADGTLTILKTDTKISANDNELFVLRKMGGKWRIDRYMFNGSEHH